MIEVSKYIEKSKKLGADIVVLPENFAMMAEYDSMYLDIKEDLGQGKIQDFLKSLAIKNDIWIIAGTIPIKTNNFIFTIFTLHENRSDYS